MSADILNFVTHDERLSSSGQPSEEQLENLAERGTQVIINLALGTSDHALPDERGTVERLGMSYIHIPVIWDQPTLQNLQDFMNSMDAHPNKKIHVHCAMNYRATAFIALWRVLRQGWDPQAAFSIQKTIWNLDEYPIWEVFVSQSLP